MIHSVSALRYRLLEGPVGLEPLRVLDSRGVDWRGWRVTFHILGASHAVCLQRGDRRLTELLTCAPPGPGGRVITDDRLEPIYRFGDPGGEVAVTVAGYTFDLDEEPDSLSGEFAPECRMEHAFPGVPGVGAPVTRLGWATQGPRLYVESVHTYPEEGRAARTETCFEWREERR